jgi:hypothetical protein
MEITKKINPKAEINPKVETTKALEAVALL